jgi:hypothetical protein
MIRWIIVAKFPSGTEMAFSYYQEKGKAEKSFALVPIEGELGTVNNAISWNTEEEARNYLDAQLKAAPELSKIGPFEIRRMLEPSWH